VLKAIAAATGQRPLPALKLNVPAVFGYFRSRASGSRANKSRMASNAPT